jgi:beta-lactamase class A
MLSSALLPTTAIAAALDSAALQRELARLEAAAGGRLGVALLDTASGALAGHRVDERFALCSSFKLLLAAAVLQACDQGRLQADQWVAYGQADMTPHAPVTQANLARGGMKLLELAEATQVTSDNPAANLLLRVLGGEQGPQWLTAWLRGLGDTTTRLDRWEPEMNRVPPGELRDTSTPAAVARTSARLLTEEVLSPASRERLIDWMVATQTGSRRLRAGLPPHWKAGDKTGTAMHPSMPDQFNDVAIVWPVAGRAPWLIAAYYAGPHRGSKQIRPEGEAVLAEVGRLAARWRS